MTAAPKVAVFGILRFPLNAFIAYDIAGSRAV